MPRLYTMRAALIVVSFLAVAQPTAAQQGGVRGTVLDTDGRPIKGASVKAENPNAFPQQRTATTDDKGRFAIIGLASGIWKFVAEAPGFLKQEGMSRIRATVTGNMPIEFTLERAALPLPGALTRQIQADLQAALDHRTAGRYDEAIAAYEEIASRNPRLTMVSMAIGETYRQKARSSDPTAQQALLDKALAAFQAALKAEPANERARIEIALVHMQKGDLSAAEQLLTPEAESPSATGELFYALGEIKLSKGDASGAEKMFQQASTLDPGWQRPKLKLGLIAVRKGDSEAAVKFFNGIIAADASSPEAAEAGMYLKELTK